MGGRKNGGMPGESCSEPTTYDSLPELVTAPSSTSSSVAPRPSSASEWWSHAEMRCGGPVGGMTRSSSHSLY